jgi:hypothetical protein
MFRTLLLLVLLPLAGRAQTNVNPLAEYSGIWNQPQYLKCNTASEITYLSAKEKELVWVLNMARLNPKLFLSTVVNDYPERSGQGRLSGVREYKSLQSDLIRLEPLSILAPDSLCRVSALCHAQESGTRGYVGHERFSKNCEQKEHFNAECCDYGFTEAVDIVMHLLIDEDIASLGHRHALLGKYQKIGVSIQPHKTYQYTAVLDFYY